MMDICLLTVQRNAMDNYHKRFGISEVAIEKIPFSKERFIILLEKQISWWQNLQHLSQQAASF